jgi:type I restriction enzyme S subunit
MKRDTDINKEVALIWNTANDVLRDIFQRTEYPDIIYPMVLIRRIESVLIAKSDEIKTQLSKQLKNLDEKVRIRIINDKLLQEIKFNNTSKYTLQILADEGESGIKGNFIDYLNGYTDNIKIIIDRSGIRSHINKLNEEKILYTLIKDFAEMDLSPPPGPVSNIKMGYIFEELVRKFSEANNAEAGEHYTPREVINLMIHMLDMDEKAIRDGELVTIYDPACGSGGMLTAAKEFIEENINKNAKVVLYGQEVNDKTWAVAQADLLLKGETAHIIKGDTLYEDGAIGEQFDFMLSNPPYGKSWKKIRKKVMTESNGRFDVGQPRSSDGQLLFTLHVGDIIVIECQSKVLPKFLQYFMTSDGFCSVVTSGSFGTKMPRTSWEFISSLRFALLSKSEQDALIQHLDWETEKLDTLIANKKAQVEKLKELRQIEINMAVTKGLDKNVELKESGMDWLGKIPKHWKVKRLKDFASKIGSGVTPKGGADVYEESGVPLFRSQNIHLDGLRLDDIAYITRDTHLSMSGSKVETNDVLLNITGASIGRCYYYDGTLGEANVNQHVCVIRTSKNLHHRFLQFYLSSDSGQSQVFMGQVGTSREGLTFQDIKNITLGVPEVAEQMAIIQYLEERTKAIDQVLKNTDQQIEKLAELRKIKIYEAVTGKIKVPMHEQVTA